MHPTQIFNFRYQVCRFLKISQVQKFHIYQLVFVTKMEKLSWDYPEWSLTVLLCLCRSFNLTIIVKEKLCIYFMQLIIINILQTRMGIFPVYLFCFSLGRLNFFIEYKNSFYFWITKRQLTDFTGLQATEIYQHRLSFFRLQAISLKILFLTFS